jgi:hypothetical protein
MTTTILNFGHPLSSRVLSHLATEDPATGEMVPARELRVALNLNLDGEPTPQQVTRAVDHAFEELRGIGVVVNGTAPIVVVLPGITEGAALVLAELHGRAGSFPRVLALRRTGDGTYGLFADSADLGIIDLERVRQEARGRR